VAVEYAVLFRSALCPWLAVLIDYQIGLILPRPCRHTLADLASDHHPAWQLVRGKRAWDHRLLSQCSPPNQYD
jgi:hypothetical protein